MKIPWYSEKAGFFGKIYMDEYVFINSGQKTQMEVDFIDKLLGFRKKSKILDICCGYGRHAVELAKRGYSVTGQDLNAFFIKRANEKAQKEKTDADFIISDMRKIPFKNEFDAVVNLFTSFGYLENDREDEKVIKQVSCALKPGGLFIIDILNKGHLMKIYREKDWTRLPDSSFILYKRSFDKKTSRNIEERIYISPNGKTRKFNIVLRVYTSKEMKEILRRNGLKVEKVFGSFAGGKYTEITPRLIILARKIK
ncbi:MAG: methyltransferase domain-containing protein [Armatimonadota bacterium]